MQLWSAVWCQVLDHWPSGNRRRNSGALASSRMSRHSTGVRVVNFREGGSPPISRVRQQTDLSITRPVHREGRSIHSAKLAFAPPPESVPHLQMPLPLELLRIRPHSRSSGRLGRFVVHIGIELRRTAGYDGGIGRCRSVHSNSSRQHSR